MNTTTAAPQVSPTDIDLTDTAMFSSGADHEAFRRLRDHEPVHWNDEPDGPGFWSVTRYEDIRAIASDPELFCSGLGTQIPDQRAEGTGAPSIHNMDAPDHQAMRRLVVPRVRPSVVRELTPTIEAAVDSLLDRALAAGGGSEPFDFVHEIAAQLPLLIIGPLLGAPVEACPHMQRWTNEMASLDPEYSAGPQTAARARDEVFDFFRELEAERRAEPTDDLVSVLTRAEVAGRPLDREQLDAYYLLLMVAGNETTRNLLSGGIHGFATHPGQWELLRSDPATMAPMAVEEMARWVSPVLSMRRTATRDTELHGTAISGGEKVVMWFCSGNRDERVFTDPEAFDISRSPNEHLGFGWGVHACLGAHLARLEARIFLSRLVERGLRVEQVGPPDRLASNFFRGIKHLPARLVPDRG